ncbi:MAG: sugar phosphate nucleotidyltransferase [Chloroflexota bacterium]|nr:sugar phosphate nucleotidyltransferase [Chloroflexota bacterium]
MPQPLKIVIPMAGYGSRLRPLTWSKPKPLVSLAGGTVLDQVLDMFHSVPDFDRAEFVFILGPTMGEQIQDYVAQHYPDFHVDYAVQPEMKGQSDAFWQARELLHGPMLMAFSDTLIGNDFSFLAEETAESVVLVKPVPDPRRFGVAEVNKEGWVTRLVEKPNDMHNNLALVGCYYFREAEDLISAIEEQIERNISLKDEYYLADAVNIMLERGLKMRTENVETWLDAGTSEALLETNRYMLDHGKDNSDADLNLEDSVIIPPVVIHPTARVSTSVIGPYVSVGEGAVIQGSTLKDSIIGQGAHITNCMLETSLVGHNATLTGQSGQFNLGDNSWAVK